MEQIRNQIAELQRRYSTLSAREKRLVTATAAAVIVFVLFIVMFNFNSTANKIRSRTLTKIGQLAEAQELAATFRENEARRQAIEDKLRRNKEMRLLTFVEEKATAAGLELPSINPKTDITLDGDKIVESAVELSLSDVKLNRMIDFLNGVESGDMVKVKYLRIEPRPANETLSAWLTIATYKMKN